MRWPWRVRRTFSRRAKEALFDLMRGEAALLARFASLIETFATPNLGVFSTIMATVGAGPDEIDIKKAGTFPIVHGVRTLAIDKGILATPTTARIEALVEQGSLEPAFGRDLISALHAFMEFRLQSQVRALHTRTMQTESLVRLDEITTVERDILRDALRIVRQFREIIRNRYTSGRSEWNAGYAISSIARRWQTMPIASCSSRDRRTRSWFWIARRPGSTRGPMR